MSLFRTTTHLSEILEESEKTALVIFKFSNACRSSQTLSDEIENVLKEKTQKIKVYRIVVQDQPVISNKIADWFEIKHETPQILVVKNGEVIYTKHHTAINIKDFL